MFHTLTVNSHICPTLIPAATLADSLIDPFADDIDPAAYAPYTDEQIDELRGGHEYREAKSAAREDLENLRNEIAAHGLDISEALDYHCDGYEDKTALMDKLGLSYGFDSKACIAMRKGKRDARERRARATQVIADRKTMAEGRAWEIMQDDKAKSAAARDALELSHIEALQAAHCTLDELTLEVKATAKPEAPKPEPAPVVTPDASSDSLEAWARAYVAELVSHAPAAARKLAKSLEFQLSQIGTCDAERWTERATLAFNAKVSRLGAA